MDGFYNNSVCIKMYIYISLITLRSGGTDILYWLSLASRRLYNILYFQWLYNEFFIIIYNILNIAELDCCQIIILSIYVPSTHAYTHVLRLSLDLPYREKVTLGLLKLLLLGSGVDAGRKAKQMVLQCINGVGSNPVEGRTNIWQL
jgi:hypothetical protein